MIENLLKIEADVRFIEIQEVVVVDVEVQKIECPQESVYNPVILEIES